MAKINHKKRIALAALAFGVLASVVAPYPSAFADEEPLLDSSQEEATTSSSEDKDKKPPIWLQISPVSNRVILHPTGDNPLSYTLTVDNVGSETFRYKLYAAPYSVTDETYEVNFSDFTPRTQLARWVTFKNEDGSFKDTASFSINPGEKQSITYQINVPDNVPEGGQYATIFAESDNDSDASETSGIRTVSRVGLVLYGRTEGETDESAEITDYQLTNFLLEGNISTSALVKNSGNTDFATEATLTVKKFFGSVAYEKTRTYDVLPDTSRRINMEWEDTPAFGIFHVTSSIHALNEDHTETKLVLIVPLYMIIIAVILLTIMIVWLIILIKKRRSQKAKLIV